MGAPSDEEEMEGNYITIEYLARVGMTIKRTHSEDKDEEGEDNLVYVGG